MFGEMSETEMSQMSPEDIPSRKLDDLKSLLRSKSAELINQFLISKISTNCPSSPNSVPSRKNSPEIRELPECCPECCETLESDQSELASHDEDDDDEGDDEDGDEDDEDADFEDDEDVDFIFEPKNLKILETLDPIEKEIEEFKLFCQVCVPAHPRLKVPLVTLNLMS